MEEKISLTSFIKGSKDYRDLIRNSFVKPKFNAGSLTAEPSTLNYGLVGTAFDYLLRFKIERENKCETRPWIASMLKQSSLAEEINIEARARLNSYLKTGKMTKALMESALKLATIDNVFRSGQGTDQIGIVNPLDLVDLANLYKLIDADKFKSKKSCYLNPTFGIGSELVNDADADLIIDGELIDIKTTITSDFKREYFEQLIGYFLLHIIDCEHRNVPVSIKKLGIYFSRHGCLFFMDVADLIDERKLPNIVAAFRDLLLISIPRKLSDEEKAKKAEILKIKAKIERKRGNEIHDVYISIFEKSRLEWLEPWSIAREVGERAIEENTNIKSGELIKIINEKINEFLTPARSEPYDELFWTGCGSSPSELLHEGSVRVAKSIVAQFRKKHLSVADKELNKEKRKKNLANKKLSELIVAGWAAAKKTGENTKESNHLLREEEVAKIIYEDIKSHLIQINCSQAVAESISIDGFGLWRKPRLLEAESARLSKLIISAFKRKQTRKNNRKISDVP